MTAIQFLHHVDRRVNPRRDLTETAARREINARGLGARFQRMAAAERRFLRYIGERV